MTTSARLSKQILFALLFFLLVGGLGYAFFYNTQPAATPTPDPIAQLAPLQILEHKLLPVGDQDYDFIAKVYNPNTEYGSATVTYQLDFFNFADNNISNKITSFYILPGQTRFLIDQPLKFSEPITRAEITIKSVDWQKLDPLAASGVDLIARNFAYQAAPRSGVFGSVDGAVLNNSNFDLGQAEVLVVLLDENASIIGANKTGIFTFLAGTSRGFEVIWPETFTGTVSRVEVEVQTNLLENSNFLRQFERQERFQQFY